MTMFSNGAIQHIHTFLSMVDIINWNKAKPHMCVAREFRLRFITHLMRRCKCSRKDAIELIAKVSERNGLFSGSSVLQVLLGELWEDSDIDIYFPANSPKYDSTMVHEILQLNKLYPVPISLYTDIPIPNTLKSPTHSFEANFYLDYNYKWDKVEERVYSNVQIISHKKQIGRPYHLLATENFDLSIVMNSYDGRKLEVYDFNKLKNRQSVVFRVMSYNRVLKYKARNIEFNHILYTSKVHKSRRCKCCVYCKCILNEVKSFNKSQLRKIT